MTAARGSISTRGSASSGVLRRQRPKTSKVHPPFIVGCTHEKVEHCGLCGNPKRCRAWRCWKQIGRHGEGVCVQADERD